jgi:hypothetical protein
MGQDYLNGFTMLDINCDLAQKLEFSSIIMHFQRRRLEKDLLNRIFSLLNSTKSN